MVPIPAGMSRKMSVVMTHHDPDMSWCLFIIWSSSAAQGRNGNDEHSLGVLSLWLLRTRV